ncbi:MAG: transposase family protein [Rhodobacteraceae bacterium]|nr:transposase family protein [Paracoccaceae bacterium]
MPMRGVLYLVAIMDWHTRKVLFWRISNTLEARVYVDALNEAIHTFSPLEIMNTDQGIQVTSFAWTDRLRRSGVRISMDRKGRSQAHPRQHLHREAVVHPELRVCLPACLGDRFADKGGHQEMDDLLQPPAPAFCLGRPASGAGFLAKK